jgi:hypothetical protein
MATQNEVFRFYRSNLPTVVWDPEKGKALAEFIGGQFFTEDKRVAGVLQKKGYPMVPLDATEPPDILFEKGRSLLVGEHAKILPPGITEEVALANEQNVATQAKLAEKASQVAQKKEPAKRQRKKDKTETQTKVDKTMSPSEIVRRAKEKSDRASKRRKISRRVKK